MTRIAKSVIKRELETTLDSMRHHMEAIVKLDDLMNVRTVKLMNILKDIQRLRELVKDL